MAQVPNPGTCLRPVSNQMHMQSFICCSPCSRDRLDHLLPHSPWKNYLQWNWSWCQERLETPAVWDSLIPELGRLSLFSLGKFSSVTSSDIFSDSFSSSGAPIMWMVVRLMSQRSLRLPSILFFFINSAPQQLFWHSVFQLTYLFFCLSYSAVDFFWCVFHFSYCVVYHCYLLFCCYSSLLHISYIFSISVSTLFLKFWIILAIIFVHPFSGSLPVSSSFIWSCRCLPCSFICDMFLVVSLFWWVNCVPVLLLFGLRHSALEFAGGW